MRDPLRPLNQGEELLVSGLTDVSHRIIWLQEMGVRVMEEVEVH